jgi:hypothetical protein
MTTHEASPTTSGTQLTDRGRVHLAPRRRTERHGIVAPGHGTAAVLISFDSSRPEPPGRERGSAS